MTAADQPTTEPSLHERIADTLAYYHCRATNSKADHPRMGYHAMSEDQRQFLRARQDEAAAEVVRIIQSLTPAPQPAADTEVQWGVRRPDSKYLDWDQEPTDSERRRIEARGDTVVKHYVTRTPWEDA